MTKELELRFQQLQILLQTFHTGIKLAKTGPVTLGVSFTRAEEIDREFPVASQSRSPRQLGQLSLL
jgi:hypothetical protein